MSNGPRSYLIDLYADLVCLARDIIAGHWDQREALALADRCDDAFAAAEALSTHGEIAQSNLQLAKYALCALIDEIVLARGGNLATQWASNPLQLRYFNDFNAGDEFYNKLEGIRHGQDQRQAQVLEIYHLCLTLGFCGRLSDRRGAERRRALIDNLATELSANRPLSQEQSATERRQQLAAPSWWRRLPAWSWPLAALLMVALVYLVLHRLLALDLAQLAEQLGAL